MTPEVKAFFDNATNTVSFVIKDPESSSVAIIDSVLDFDFSNGRTDTVSADKVISYVKENDLQVEWILESHVHADHLSAAPYIQKQLGGKIGIGANITVVQGVFGKVFNEGSEFQRDGSQFDKLFVEGDVIEIGNMKVDIMHTPGHTPACMTYVVGNAAFVGDTMFMPDFGTARCDFPGGSAEDLYASIQKILALPDDTRIFVGHDYKAPGRDEFAWETSVAEQKTLNVHVGVGKDVAQFVDMRTKRDKELSMPKLIVPSIQINMRAGRMPEPEENGQVYLKVPVNAL
jgi:glyoxylase-like metal-dependent hydrolase (beta-lactamase superfamily II)